MSAEILGAELAAVRRHRRHMDQAKRDGREIELRTLPSGGEIWVVPADLVAKVGCMFAVVRS